MKYHIPIFILLFCIACACFAQPYEPIILLDVIGEEGDVIGKDFLQPIGDTNDDGLEDILTMVAIPGGGGLRIYRGSNTGQISCLQFGSEDTTDVHQAWLAGPGFIVPQGDVNGDTFPDILLDLCRWDGQCILLPVLFLGGPVLFDTLPDWIGVESEERFTTNVGDYDGDGRDDVTRRPLNPDYFGFYRSDDPMPSTPTWTMSRGTGNTQYGHDNTGAGDFNGDGFSDFGIRYSNLEDDEYYSHLDLFLGSPEADSLPGYVYQWGTVPQERVYAFHFVGDINGDGYDDLISNFQSWWTGFQKQLYYGGNPFDFEVDAVFLHVSSNLFREQQIGLGDINHDSYDDFAIYGTPADAGPDGIEIYLGGDPPSLEPVWILDTPFEGMAVPYRVGPAGDFNGDGIDDWMFSCYEEGERRGRIIVIAGDERFGLPAHEAPELHPSSFTLHPCFPNPFNSTVTIPFELTGSRMQRIAFTIYNTLGQIVYSFPTQTYTPGNRSLQWNGETSTGSPTTGGVYFLVAKTATSRHTAKLIYVP